MSWCCAARVRLGPNSHLRPSGSWLRWAKPCWCRPIGRSASSSANGRRDHRHVGRQREVSEQVQQGQQAVGPPARVVVAEEHRDRAVALLERLAHWLQHHLV
jgi:hypothetical protein